MELQKQLNYAIVRKKIFLFLPHSDKFFFNEHTISYYISFIYIFIHMYNISEFPKWIIILSNNSAQIQYIM